MPPIEVRPLRRSDRQQLTALVNAHVEAVLPGVSVSPNAVLSQLERDPGEYVVDPWVVERRTLVAVLRDRVCGVAHLLRYGDDDRVGPGLRGLGELSWLLFWPGQHAAGRAEMDAVADALVAAAVRALAGCTGIGADGALPAPSVHGVPDRWPHVAAALSRAGFVPGGPTEVVLAARVGDLPVPGPPPVAGLGLEVALGGRGTRFSARLAAEVVGMYEVASDLTEGGTLSRLAGWAEGWELWVRPDLRRRGVATWLLGHGAERLRFAGAERVLDHAALDGDDGTLPFLAARGYRELARTRRGWRLR